MTGAGKIAAWTAALLTLSSPATADWSRLHGKTLIVFETTQIPATGYRGTTEERYYFTKDGKHALLPFDAESYGPGKGVIYTLDDRTCHLLRYEYESAGNIVFGSKHICGQMVDVGNAITLNYEARDDNGLGYLTLIRNSMTIEISPSGECRTTGYWTATMSTGTTEGLTAGHCEIRPGRDPAMFE